MLHKINLLFWLRRKQPTKEGLTPVYLRISIKGQKNADVSTGIALHPLQWDSKRQCIRGRSDAAKIQNIQLQQLKNKMLTNFITLQQANKSLTPHDIRNGYTNDCEIFEPLTNAIKSFMEHEKKQVGAGEKMTESTYRNKENFCAILLEFIKPDPLITVDKISPRWAKRFFDWLLFEKKYKPGYVCNIRVFLKEVTKYCFDQELINGDPLHNLNYVIKKKYNEVVYTPMDEITLIKNYSSDNLNENISTDLYLLACYTGLGYSDSMRLDIKKDIITNDSGKWIDMSRIKTKIDFLIPLLPEAETILNNYNGVPRINLSSYNKALTRISNKLQLNKKLSSHKGRKSFSMLIQEQHKMPLQAASLMLGHTDENTTKKHYTAKKVNNERREKSIAFGIELNRLVRA